MFKIKPKQATFVYGEDVYNNLIPKDHFLCKVNESVDFSFANKECADLYSPDMGRGVTNTPERMLRAEFVQYYYHLSDREMEEQAKYNIVVKWFLGLNLDEHGFDYSALSVFRSLLGEERHRTLFEKILGQIISAGLITKDEKQYIDATNIIANIALPTVTQLINDGTRRIIAVLKECNSAGNNLEMRDMEERALQNPNELKLPEDVKKKRLVQAVADARRAIKFAENFLRENATSAEDAEKLETLIKMQKQVLQDNTEEKIVDGESSIKTREKGKRGTRRMVSYVDPDAKWGGKSWSNKFPGYKVHSTVSKNRFVTNIGVTDASVRDSQPAVRLVSEQQKIGLKPYKVIGDCIYGMGKGRRDFKDMGIQFVAPLRYPWNPVVGMFTNDMFIYDKDGDSVTCPGGQVTTHFSRMTGNARKFRFSRKQCAACRSKELCTNSPYNLYRSVDVSDFYQEFEDAKIYNKSEEYKKEMNERRCIAEQKQAEMKQRHGLKRARYRGLSKVSIQAYLTAIVVNIKRFVKMIYQQIGRVST